MRDASAHVDGNIRSKWTKAVESETWFLLREKERIRKNLFEYPAMSQDAAQLRYAQGKLDDSVMNHFDHVTQRWKDEMDNSLLYATLFSAILTAFNIESYKLFQQSSGGGAEAVLLVGQQSGQHSGLHDRFIPAIINRAGSPESPLLSSSAVVLLNSLWFASLILSLASTSAVLLVKQWIYELTFGLSGNSRSIAQLRQLRLESVRKWRVETFIILIPLVLQLALILFFAGLLVLLWNLDTTVASTATGLTGAFFLFIIIITIIPTIHWDCGYRSPQASMIFKLLLSFRHVRQQSSSDLLDTLHASPEEPSTTPRQTQPSKSGAKAKSTSTGRSATPESEVFSRLKARLRWKYLPLRVQKTKPAPWTVLEQSILPSSMMAGPLNVLIAFTACETMFDSENCLDWLKIVVCANPDVPLVNHLKRLGLTRVTDDNPAAVEGTSAAALLRKAAPVPFWEVAFQALQQLIIQPIPPENSAQSKRTKQGARQRWEADVEMLLQQRINEHALSDDALRICFFVSMISASVNNKYATLCCLAEAVRPNRSPPCESATAILVLQSAERWIKRHKHASYTGLRRKPQVWMLAFSTVACCVRCALSGSALSPELHRIRARATCARARVTLRSLLDFLPPGPGAGAPPPDPDFCGQLWFGLSVLVEHLVCITAMQGGLELVDADIVLSLDLAWSLIKPVLKPHWFPSYSAHDSASLPLDERLQLLWTDVRSLLPQNMVEVLQPPDAEHLTMEPSTPESDVHKELPSLTPQAHPREGLWRRLFTHGREVRDAFPDA